MFSGCLFHFFSYFYFKAFCHKLDNFTLLKSHDFSTVFTNANMITVIMKPT